MDGPSVLAALVVLIVLFLILRRFVLWYWRINEAVRLLESIERHLSFMSSRNEPEPSAEIDDQEPESLSG